VDHFIHREDATAGCRQYPGDGGTGYPSNRRGSGTAPDRNGLALFNRRGEQVLAAAITPRHASRVLHIDGGQANRCKIATISGIGRLAQKLLFLSEYFKA
jgi:hypothetical protein